jgi:hypothetical protein
VDFRKVSFSTATSVVVNPDSKFQAVNGCRSALEGYNRLDSLCLWRRQPG